MGLEKQTLPNTQRMFARMRTIAMQAAQAGQRCVVLAARYDGVMQLKKQWADEDFSFGLTVSTLSSWLQDRWELFGDGRGIVSSMERELFMSEALWQAQENELIYELAHTPGTVKLLASMAREDLVWLIDDARIDQSTEELTHAEKDALKVLKRYTELLEKQGKCELVQTMEIVADLDFSVPVLVVEDRGEFTRAETAFFSKLSHNTEVYITVDGMSLPAKSPDRARELVDLQSCIFEPDTENPLEPSGAVRFLLPAGNYAAPLLIARSIVEFSKMGDRRIGVSAKDQRAIFEQTKDYISSAGLSISCAMTERFERSDFGSMWLTLLRFMFEEQYATSFQVSDILMSTFSDVSQRKASELDLAWRANRTLEKEDYIRDLSHASPLFAHVLDAIRQRRWADALDAFEDFVKERIRWTKAYRAEQQKAISAARSFFETMEKLGGDPIRALPQLAEHSLAISVFVPGKTPASSRVDIMSLEALSEAEACSYDTVILCDLNAVSYPIRDTDDAKTRLFSKLGNIPSIDALTSARECFFRVLSVPVKRLVCERALNTFEANKNYPSVMLEELFDCYRHDLLALDEVDRTSGMPKVLLPFAERAGENMLYRNLVVLDREQTVGPRIGPCSHGVIREESKEKIVLSHRGKTQVDTDRPLLSPSAIESYLECPYKWFALRRLRLEGIDAGFGALEMGIFSHELLREFYQRFQELGNERVLPENLPQAKEFLADLFDQQIALQADKKSKDRPLIATTKLEEAEIRSLKKTLVAYLDREALLLPGFTPRYFEQSFGQDLDLEFAGALLHGTIDRIDVNEKGQAIVIDYKGSVDAEYAFETTSELPWIPECSGENILALPNKVQTLLYAQAARKELGLEVVGGLYLSYGKNAVAGAYDPKVLGPAEIPSIKPELSAVTSESAPDFSSMLDDFEATLKTALDCLKRGHIRPYPRGKDPCGYCPVTTCEMRR